MPHPAAAPHEADALRRLAEAMTRVHFPAPLLQFLLALLAFLTGNKAVMAQLTMATASARTWRTPQRDWHFPPTAETTDDPAPVPPPRPPRPPRPRPPRRPAPGAAPPRGEPRGLGRVPQGSRPPPCRPR